MVAACRADLVVCQEARDPQALARIAQRAGLAYCEARRGRSLGFMSRLPPAHFAWYRPRFSRHAFLEVVPAGGSCPIIGVHLSAVHSAWTEQRRLFEIRALIHAITKHAQGPHLLVGDFNSLAPGERLDARLLPHRLRALVWLSGGQIRWRVIQTILDAGYLDVFRQHHPEDPGLTFPTWAPHVRLDYAFVPQRHGPVVNASEVVTTGPRRASDHFPLLLDVEDLASRISA